MPNERFEKALRLLGLAARAGKTVPGVSLICAALSKGGGKAPLVVLEACDSSENSHKRITDRTTYYRVPCYRLDCDTAALARAAGKRDGALAAVGITEPHLAGAVRALLEE